MLIFYTNVGGLNGGPTWYVGPLLLLAPLLLQLFGAGILSLPLQLLSLLFGGGAVFSSTTSYMYDPAAGGWRQVESGGGTSAGLLGALATLLVAGGTFAAALALARQVRRHGLGATLRTVRQLLLTGWQGGGGAGGQRAGGQPQRRAAGTQQERWARVTHLVQTLPTEVYHSREELEAMPVGELLALLRKSGAKPGPGGAPPLEKRELIDVLMSGANSSSSLCSICCEDYAAGDVLRALPCGHRFHLECIDRWLLSSTDYSRPPACPMCNAELVAPPTAS